MASSGDICPGFQNQSGSLTLSPAHNGFLTFTSSATPADLLTASIATEPQLQLNCPSLETSFDSKWTSPCRHDHLSALQVESILGSEGDSQMVWLTIVSWSVTKETTWKSHLTTCHLKVGIRRCWSSTFLRDVEKEILLHLKVAWLDSIRRIAKMFCFYNCSKQPTEVNLFIFTAYYFIILRQSYHNENKWRSDVASFARSYDFMTSLMT